MYRYLEKPSVSVLVFRLQGSCPVNKEVSDRLEALWAGLSRQAPSLKVFLFQIEDQMRLGWMKKPGGWVKMTAEEARKLVASEDIFPTSIEPCEQCER